MMEFGSECRNNKGREAGFGAAIFDLDGTLLDTLQDLTDSFNEALTRHGFPPHPPRVYRSLIGSGARRLVERAVGRDTSPDAVSADLVEAVLASFTDRYRRTLDCRTRPYEGIPELLTKLSARGIRLAVLSNKSDDCTKALVARFFPDTRFEAVLGLRPDVPAKPDPTSALGIAAAMGFDPGCVVYVGDSGSDMTTACRAGMVPAGVLWGYRDREELLAAGARFLSSHPEELERVFA